MAVLESAAGRGITNRTEPKPSIGAVLLATMVSDGLTA
jgi:hypothetical protein